MGVESYGLFLGVDFSWRFARGSVWASLIFVIGVAIFCRGFPGCGAAQTFIYSSSPGIQCGAALLVRQSCDYQFVFRREERGQAIGTCRGSQRSHRYWRFLAAGWWSMLPGGGYSSSSPLCRGRNRDFGLADSESRSATAGRIDWLGALLPLPDWRFDCWIHRIGHFGLANPLVFGSLMSASAALSLSCLSKQRQFTDAPARAVRVRSFSGANLLRCSYMLRLEFLFLVSLNLIQVQRYSATAAGAAVLPLILLMFLSFPLVWRTCGALWSERH